MANVNDIQHGGTHYKVVKYQPWDVVLDWELGYLDGTALKYISRWKKKNGLEDIKKAIHFLQKLVEVEESKPAPTITWKPYDHDPMKHLHNIPQNYLYKEHK